MHPRWIWRRRQQLLNFERALQLKGAELSSAQASINDLVDRSTQHIYQDRLTGLLNSRGLEQQLADWVELAMSGDGNVGVLAVEVDSFHDYIKLSGQLSAELCHLKISEALQRTLSNDAVCVATEQSGYFVVVLNGASLSLAQATAGRLREAINDLQLSNPASTVKEHVTVSIGCFDLVSLVNRLVSINSYPEMERTRWLANQLLTEAKSHLAVCQQAGGDQVFPKT
nr:diguanylate cyclase [Simiduia aestuariiviva]